MLEGADFQQPLPLLLLTYLALEGPQARRVLAELFWPDAKDPRDSLGSALRLMKRSATGSVEADRVRAYSELPCDAKELLSQLDAGDSEAAVAQYQGSFLEGLDLSLGEELEEWVYATREYIAGRVRTALIKLGEQAAAQGHIAPAASHAERAYLLRGAPKPDPEDFQRLYTLLQAGGSPRAGEVRKEADSFGIELTAPTQPRCIEPVPAKTAIPSQEVTSTPRHNLPSRSTGFVGRDPELLEIAGLLTKPECRLLTVHGAGGMGKSRLALQAAGDLLRSEAFNDGIFFVGLDAVTQPELIPSSIANAVGIDLLGQVDPLVRV